MKTHYTEDNKGYVIICTHIKLWNAFMHHFVKFIVYLIFFIIDIFIMLYNFYFLPYFRIFMYQLKNIIESILRKEKYMNHKDISELSEIMEVLK